MLLIQYETFSIFDTSILYLVLYRVPVFFPIRIILFLFHTCRYDNRGKYEELWNRQHVEQVEIMMKERVDVKGKPITFLILCNNLV